ncbi:biopolymer transporter ExbD [Aquabacterium sp.]|uniref:ExbD/TolR family protein n=1 Tax=Aquabacterium sp. TaxID=1872578 RepID=UPI002489E650|nr:biopolymer transporter ExbD [Aquabacterium sp.]MDI1257651.1 biopolymer transporter ExbD [Aquabacterium sp.]
MAFGRLERRQGAQPMSEINMTPLIDVMLVLLVIFMLTAPLMTSSLKLNLPKADAKQSDATPHSLMISLSADGQTYLNDSVVTAPGLVAQAKEAARQSADTEVQLRADEAVSYGRVAELIGLLQQAGLSRIAFVTEAKVGVPEKGVGP